MPVPYYYSSTDIALTIDPHGLENEANTVRIAREVISDRIEGIHRVWKNLTVGWVGETSEEADAFNDEWNAALTKLFGTQEDPKSGVLNLLAVGVSMAAFNYALTEETTTTMFRQFTDAVNGHGAPQESAIVHMGPDPVDTFRDRNDGPIHEVTHLK